MGIGSLRTAEELSEKLGQRVTAGRLMELAEAQLIPHYELEGRIYFKIMEAKKWIENDLVFKVSGQLMPHPVSIIQITETDMEREPPKALKALWPHLIPVSVASIQCAALPGIYFLCREGIVSYVGQSTNVAARISQHATEKTFDYAFYMRVPRSDIIAIEAELIAALRPADNKTNHTEVQHQP